MPNRACDDRVSDPALRLLRSFASLAGVPGLLSAIADACGVARSSQPMVFSVVLFAWGLMDSAVMAQTIGESAAGCMRPADRLADGFVHFAHGQCGWAY